MAKTRKTQLEQAFEDIANAKDVLQNAYAVESDRATLAGAINDALDILENYAGGDDNGDDDDDDEG